jgi:hypothetical protein
LSRRVFCWLAAVLPAAGAESSARRKLIRLQEDRAPAGWTNFSAKEVNQLALEEVAATGLAGVREPTVEMGNNTAIGRAKIDFARVRESATGEAPSTLARLLLGGEKDVLVEAAFASAAGTCTISLVRASINGLEIRGRLLDWLVENYLLPLYPEAKVAKPFSMGHRVERVEITPARARFRVDLALPLE